MKSPYLSILFFIAIVFSVNSLAQTNRVAMQLPAISVPSYVPSNNLIGWWPFNGNANDESGNSNNGAVNGATLTTDRTGNVNAAYSFNGINNSITLGNVLNPAVQNAITISAWFSVAQSLSSSNQYTGIDIGKKPVNHLSLRTVSSKFQCVHGQPSPPNAHYVSVMSTATNVNQWYHVVGIYKNNEAHLYVNGIEQTDLANIGNFLSTIPAASELFFGVAYVDNYVPYYYKGKLDDIGIWNRELTVCEIKDLYLGTITSNTIITPSMATANIGGQVQFSTNVSSGTIIQWQTNPLNLGWQNVNNSQNYSGTNTNNLAINNLALSNHAQVFRVLATTGNCRDTSNIASIAISDTCINSVTDTNYVTLTDTNYVTLTDTNYISITDTNYVTVSDTDYVLITDTNYVLVTDTNYVTLTDTVYITVTDTLVINNCHGHGHGHGHGNGHGNGHCNGNSISVYPNPSHDYINIDCSNFTSITGCTLQIEDTFGQIVFTTPVLQQLVSNINISSWSINGTYYVRLLDAQHNSLDVKKILLK